MEAKNLLEDIKKELERINLPEDALEARVDIKEGRQDCKCGVCGEGETYDRTYITAMPGIDRICIFCVGALLRGEELDTREGKILKIVEADKDE